MLSKNKHIVGYGALLIVLIAGMQIPVMDIDAAQYASIAMEMLKTGNWLEVQHRGADYLDKPPLHFWMSALAFKCFGIETWSYKLPSVLVAILSVWSIFKVGLMFYSTQTARFASLLLASSLGFTLMCNDVRTDTLLMGFTTFSVWQLAAWNKNHKYRFLVGAFAGIGLAMLSKGPLGAVVPASACLTHWILKRELKAVFQWQWLLGLGITALILLPMCIGLYQQFDLHPEKTVNGQTNVSGLYFYFWEQSFGRITGENTWKNNTPFWYFTHVYLWAFLPWSALLIPAVYKQVKRFFSREEALKEGYSLGAFLLIFAALSASRYKLPHYIFVTLPWASLLLSNWLTNLKGKTLHYALTAQRLVSLLGSLIISLIPLFVFPTQSPYLWIPFLLFTCLTFLLLNNPPDAERLVYSGVVLSLTLSSMLNMYFYPQLLPYQSSSNVAKQIFKDKVPIKNLYFLGRHGHALDFYSKQITHHAPSVHALTDSLRNQPSIFLYTNQVGKEALTNAGTSYRVLYTMPHFQVALLNLKFLYHKTRPASLENTYLLEIHGKKNK